MEAEESYFKFRGRNVLLEILEDWYQKKTISSEDSVEIAENSDGPFVEYKMKTLITLYGAEFPFRRIRRERWDPYSSSSSDSSSDGEFDVRPDAEPLFPAAPVNSAPIKMGGRFPPPKSALPPPPKEQNSIPVPEVSKEAKKIAPKTAKPHATVAPLKRKSPEVETTSSVAPTLRHFPFDRFPLLNPKTGCGPSQLSLGVIIDLFNTNEHLDALESYLKLIVNTVPKLEKCELCDEKLTDSAMKRFDHIFSKTHFSKLETLERISPREIYFWHNLFSIYREMGTKMPLEILTNQNQIPVALIDFRIDAFNLSSQSERTEKLRLLKKQWNIVPKDLFAKASFNEYQQNPEIRCWFCSQNFKSRVHLFEHIFTKKHLQYLETFGYSEEALTAVKRKFEAANEVRQSPAPAVTAPKKASPPQNQSKTQNSRVPMLDAPPSKAKLANQAQFVEALRFIETSLTKEVKDVAAKKLGNFKCTYCPRDMILKTELQVLEHIMSQKHKEHMKFGSSSDDLNYWVERVKVYQIPEVEEMKKEPQVVDSTDSAAPQNANIPRVPLLDPATSKLVDEQTFHMMMNRARTSFASGGNAVECLVKKKVVYWKCSFCSNVKKLQTELMAFVHITSKKHCENIKTLSSLEDLEYWNNWVERLLFVASKITEISYNPVGCANHRPPISAVKTSNSPRIPLLDVPTQNQPLVSRKDYRAHYYTIRKAMLSNPPNSSELGKSVNCKCFVCPGATQQFKNLREVMQHVFNGAHLKHMNYVGTKEDFAYWTAIMCPAKPKPPQTMKTAEKWKPPCTVSQELQETKVAPEPSIGLSMTKLSLFHKPDFAFGGGCFKSPTVHILRTVAMGILPENRTESLKKKAFSIAQAICPFCHLDMAQFAYWQVIEHAFSVEHLHAASCSPGVFVTENDYKFWLSFLTHITHRVARDALSEEPTFIQKLVLKPGAVFSYFSAAELEMIDKFEGPIDPAGDCRSLIKFHSACLCCNQWTLDPVEIVKHRLSDRHIEQARIHRPPVVQSDIDKFMCYVRKPSFLDNCNIM